VDAFAAEIASANSLAYKPKRFRSLAEDIGRSLATENLSHIDERPKSVELGEMEESSTLRAAKGRNKVYAGKRRAPVGVIAEVPRLFDICVRVCQRNIDSIEETGDIPFDILRPILERCNEVQLARIEAKNPYLEEDSDELWELHCRRLFPGSKQRKAEAWKETYQRMEREQESRLKKLSQRIISHTRDHSEGSRIAKEVAPIAPPGARRQQIRNGLIGGLSRCERLPSALELSAARRQIFNSGNDADLRAMPMAVRNTQSTLGGSSGVQRSNGIKRPPLMAKTLRMLKKRAH